MKLLITARHSFLLFIIGFPVKIQNSSKAFRAEISFSMANIHILPHGRPRLHINSIAVASSGSDRNPRLLLAGCSFTRTAGALPVSQRILRYSSSNQSDKLLQIRAIS